MCCVCGTEGSLVSLEFIVAGKNERYVSGHRDVTSRMVIPLPFMCTVCACKCARTHKLENF